jgi:uncharacterized protein
MSQENVELVREAYEAFNRGDLASVLEFQDEKVDWYPAIVPLLGIGPVHGRPALEKFFTVDLVEGFAEFSAKPSAFEDLGEAVLCRTHYSAKGKASGVPVVLDAWSLIKLRGGKAVEFHDYDTKAEALEAAGLPESDG